MAGFKDSVFGDTTIKDVVEKELGEEVVAVGYFTQGKAPSMASMLTGTALIGMARRRASKTLPKRFLLAVCADRVVALRGAPISDEEDGGDRGAVVRGEAGSWPRAEVEARPLSDDAKSKGGILTIAGESIPVYDPALGHPRERQVFAALAA
jgi:hypothetical protein